MDREKQERQIDNLINTVEKHTRTERHLEQYSNIGNPYFKDEAREKQSIREKQIVDLKGHILGEVDKITPNEHLENLVDNYEGAEGYINNNRDSLSTEQLFNMEKKQANRRIQMQNMVKDPSDGEDF